MCSTCRKKTRAAGGKNIRLQETYDITHDEWLEILELQGGRCAICLGTRTSYDTDHDHRAEKVVGVRASVRGLLCRRCNRRLLPGCTDSIEVLMRAIAYLQNPPAHNVLQPCSAP